LWGPEPLESERKAKTDRSHQWGAGKRNQGGKKTSACPGEKERQKKEEPLNQRRGVNR